MLRRPTCWLYRKLGRHYVRAAIAVQLQSAYPVVTGGVLLFSAFADVSASDRWHVVVAACILAAVENIIAFFVASRLLRPADPWMRGEHTPASAIAAWRALAGLPLSFMRFRGALPVFANVVPISAYATWLLDLPVFPSFFVLSAIACVVLLYGVLLRYFGFEIITRPVLEEVSAHVPPGADLGRTSLNVKPRLLVALPAINIISGVVVSALSGGRGDGINALGFGVLVAIVVAFTVSLELSALLSESILVPLRAVRDGTRRVADGDLSARVPVFASDEIGTLASSFNTMVAGLEERERLREALGAYVDPGVAERIATEGTELGGEEVEVTVLFLDIRGFTAFAERASAGEVVAELNAFYECVVPVITRHGGHANKFIGDGLLAVFGAPRRLRAHADGAVTAAVEIVDTVERRYGGSFRIGIGINSGPVVAGTIGGGGRVDFTVIGDAVNTAARVEEVTRRTGDNVLITEATRCLLLREHGALAERPTAELKGKTERVPLYAVTAAGVADAPSELDSGIVAGA